MNGDGLRAPLETGAREPTQWGNRTIGRDGLRAPLETGMREPTPCLDRIELGANDPRAWRERAIDDAYGTGTALGGGLLRNAATCRGSSSLIHAACVGCKAEAEETGAQAPASACTAAQPHPPPEPPPTILPETVADPKRALVLALQNDLSRMSVLLERLDELLSA